MLKGKVLQLDGLRIMIMLWSQRIFPFQLRIQSSTKVKIDKFLCATTLTNTITDGVPRFLQCQGISTGYKHIWSSGLCLCACMSVCGQGDHSWCTWGIIHEGWQVIMVKLQSRTCHRELQEHSSFVLLDNALSQNNIQRRKKCIAPLQISNARKHLHILYTVNPYSPLLILFTIIKIQCFTKEKMKNKWNNETIHRWDFGLQLPQMIQMTAARRNK